MDGHDIKFLSLSLSLDPSDCSVSNSVHRQSCHFFNPLPEKPRQIRMSALLGTVSSLPLLVYLPDACKCKRPLLSQSKRVPAASRVTLAAVSRMIAAVVQTFACCGYTTTTYDTTSTGRNADSSGSVLHTYTHILALPHCSFQQT